MPKKLTDLFNGVDLGADVPQVEGTKAARPAPPKGESKRKRPSTKKPGGKRVGRPPMSVGRAADLQRKELALTPKQADQLLILSRQLNRARDKQAEGTEPITESALVRCALEALLKVKGQLSGNNEQELLDSVMEALGL